MATRIVRPDTAFSITPRSATKQKRIHAKNHLAWIRTLPCLITGTQPVEAAHIRFADAQYGKRETGMGEKPDDCWTVPLCPEKHREQHSMNEREFWDKHGINVCIVALALWINTGNDAIAINVLNQYRER